MYYMALQSTMSKPNEDLFHDSHLQLQEQMRNPIAFYTKMKGDIMYLQQALRQSDAKEFFSSRHQRSQQTCGLQQLDTAKKL
jgi:hypothetical protein